MSKMYRCQNIDECIDNVGNNLKSFREKRGLSQNKLARKSDVTNTAISSYEHSDKTPNLATSAKLAKALDISIDQLVYGGDVSIAASEEKKGRTIVNCIYVLWKNGIIYSIRDELEVGEGSGVTMRYSDKASSIKRLLKNLNEYRANINTYPEPEKYLEMILSSVANEIDDIYEKEERDQREFAERCQNRIENKNTKTSST